MLNVTELIGFGAGSNNPLTVARGASASAGDGATMSLTATSGGLPASPTRKIIILVAAGARTLGSLSCTVDGVAATLLTSYGSGAHEVGAFIASVPSGSSWSVVVTHSGGDPTGEGSLIANWCVDNMLSTTPASAAAFSSNAVTANQAPGAWLWMCVSYGAAVNMAGSGFTVTSVVSTHPWSNWWYEAAEYLPVNGLGSKTVTGAGLLVGVALW